MKVEDRENSSVTYPLSASSPDYNLQGTVSVLSTADQHLALPGTEWVLINCDRTRGMEKANSPPMPVSNYSAWMNSELKREFRQKLGPAGCSGGTGFPHVLWHEISSPT